MKILFFLALTALVARAADEPGAKVPQKIDVKGLKVQEVDDVVVPMPFEIFNVLDRLGKPHWEDVLRKTKSPIAPMPDREQTALLLGTVIAEGFIAVEATEAEEVKRIGRSVQNLSKAIGVEKAAYTRSKAIIDAADKKEWRNVRAELDKALGDVKQAMTEMGDLSLSHLVSLGGWVRGTEALTQVVEKEYRQDGADLLHQPALVDHFDRRIGEMKPASKNKPVVTEVRKALAEIRPLMGSGGPISEKTVKEVGDIAERVVKRIQTK
jgi:hypothetical protein